MVKKAPKFQISDVIASAMEGKGLSIRSLAEKLDVVYETVRGFVNGNAIPSPPMVEVLAKILEEDATELERIAVADRIRRKYGKIPMEIAGKNPELEPIERVWKLLSEEHKEDIIAMVQAYARRDKKGGK